MANLGKIIIFAGLLIVALGFLIMLFSKFNIPLGRFPGDIIIRKDNFSLYIPVTTCILISVVISLFLMIFIKK